MMSRMMMQRKVLMKMVINSHGGYLSYLQINGGVANAYQGSHAGSYYFW